MFVNLPDDLDSLDEYYPDETTQKILKKKKDREDKVVNVFYAMHEVCYKEYLHDQSYFESAQENRHLID